MQLFSQEVTLQPGSNLMAEIFISYARSDRDYARRLASYLEDAGLSVWWDMSLKPGEVFREEIERRIGEARHVIVLWSETSVKSHFVLDEASDAAQQNKLVPLRIDGCKLPYGFGQHHTHTVGDWPGDLAPVLATVGGFKTASGLIPAPTKNAQDFFIGGVAALNEGAYDRAISDFSEAIRLNPDFAHAYCNRGVAYSQKGDDDRVIADCNNAIRLNPNDAVAYTNRGVAYYMKEQYVRAISDFDQVLRINPNDKGAAANKVLAKNNLAQSYRA